MARKSRSNSESDDDGSAGDDSGTNYVMGQIVVDDGSAGDDSSNSDADQYEEIDPNDDVKTKAARSKLIKNSNSNDFKDLNPSGREDFLKDSYFDGDGWPSNLE